MNSHQIPLHAFLWTAILLCVSCSLSSPGAVDAKATSVVEVPATVAVVSPRLEQLSRGVVLSGEFRPYQQVDLHAKVAGYLRQITVDVGSFVQAGQLIATLEIPEMDAEQAHATAQRSRAEAELIRATADIARAEANLKLVVVSHDRLREVAKTEPGLIAQQEIDEALAKRQAAEAQVSSARAELSVQEQGLAAARAAEKRVQTMAAYSHVSAPFAGVITKRFADPGAMIQAGTASQTQAMPVVRLAEINRLRLVASVPESAVPMVHTGQRLEIRVTSLDRRMTGTVARLNKDVATSSRTMEAEIDVANPGALLTPGMYAEISLNLEKREPSLTVPVQAVSGSGTGRSVYVVNTKRVVEERAIRTGIESASSFEVLSGVGMDDHIIIGNRSLLRPGQMVQAKLAENN